MFTRIQKRGDLIKTTHGFTPNRRNVLKGLAGGAATGALGLAGIPAHAATNVDFMGWLGYDVFLEADDFLTKNDLSMDKTFINAPEEIAWHQSRPTSALPYFLHFDFMASEGLILPLDTSKLTNWPDLIPTILDFSRDNMTHDGEWYSAPFTWASICLMYNPKFVTEEPTSWLDMLKPEYEGKVAIPADLPSVFSTWGRVATDAPEPNLMTHEQLEQTVEFLIHMKENNLLNIAASYGELIDMLAREEVVMAQGFEAISIWVGEPEIRYTYPDEGCMTFIEGWSISAGSDRLDEVHALIDQSISVEGQLAGAAANGMPVTNAKAVSLLDDWNRNAYPYDDIAQFFTTKLRVDPIYHLEPDGVHATWDDYIAAWEDVLKA